MSPRSRLRAAQEAGIPSVAVANFTWHDIYSEYAETDTDAALLRQMAAEYWCRHRRLPHRA